MIQMTASFCSKMFMWVCPRWFTYKTSFKRYVDYNVHEY